MRLRRALLTAATPILILLPGFASGAGVRQEADLAQTSAATTKAERRIDPTLAAKARRGVQDMIESIHIPYADFSLANGLRVLVLTDRSVPTVNVSMWYDVGSRHEIPGRSGFAHLFEHLMFNGSENVPGDYLEPLLAIGATVNGGTSPDRTNYYATVPTEGLERALFMESDRMGYFLGTLSQATLDEQRGVVKNEKRQNDNNADSIVNYKATAAIYPRDHPYGHSVIGSMKDLDAAGLEDVRAFFKRHYGPNNAMLVLAGNVDVPTAKTLVQRYFGAIRPVAPIPQRAAAPVLLDRTIRESVTAPVSNPIILRRWSVAGGDNLDSAVLELASSIMGATNAGMSRRLVQEQRLLESIWVSNSTNLQAGEFTISARVRAGVDVKVAAAALDREIELFVNGKPSSDAMLRSITNSTFQMVQRLDDVNIRAQMLGEYGAVGQDPERYKVSMRTVGAQTPDSMMKIVRRWLARPRYELTVMPGPRVQPDDDMETAAPATATVRQEPIDNPPAPSAVGTRGPLPPVRQPTQGRFPAVEHAKLSNGIPIIYGRTSGRPYTSVYMEIDGGTLNEPAGRAGAMDFMYKLLKDGYDGRDKDWINDQATLLGISMWADANADSGMVSLSAPNVNLATGLEQVRLMLTEPTFSAASLEKLKEQKLEGLSQVARSPEALIGDVFPSLLDAGSPYIRLNASASPAGIRRIDRQQVFDAFNRWVRPEHARIKLVSSKPLAELLPMLEATIGSWKAKGRAVPVPSITYTPRPGKPQIVLIDKPSSVQAAVQGGQVMSLKEDDPLEAMALADQVLGSTFTSRINMNLRQDKHWTYGAEGRAVTQKYGSQYNFSATIQQDKVGAAIAEVTKEVRDIVGERPISTQEFDTAKASALGTASSLYTGPSGISLGLDEIFGHDRPDDYPGKLSDRIRAVTRDRANAELRAQLKPDQWVWVIVGDAAIIRPQLGSLGLPLTVIKAEDVKSPNG